LELQNILANVAASPLSISKRQIVIFTEQGPQWEWEFLINAAGIWKVGKPGTPTDGLPSPHWCSRQASSSSLVQQTALLILIGTTDSPPHPHWCNRQHSLSSLVQQTALLIVTGATDITPLSHRCNRQHGTATKRSITERLCHKT
jgi:hypothetical protein